MTAEMMLVDEKALVEMMALTEMLALADIPERLRDIMGREAVVVAEKRLTKDDVAPINNRLSVPGRAPRAALERFMSEEERGRIDGVEVAVADEHGREYRLSLKRLIIIGRVVYSLACGDWNDLVAANSLCEGDRVRVYAFRRGTHPCFAVVAT